MRMNKFLLEGIFFRLAVMGTSGQQIAFPIFSTMPPLCGTLVSLKAER